MRCAFLMPIWHVNLSGMVKLHIVVRRNILATLLAI